jgi:heme/copper-type cytochrome/quinol oxidase subunit 4
MGPYEVAIGVGLTLLLTLVPFGISLAISAMSPVLFWISRICFVGAALDLVCFAAYLFNKSALFESWKLLASVAVGLGTLALLAPTLRWVNYLEALASKVLRPGKEPMPPHDALRGVPGQALMVFLGTNLAWATRMPHTVLMMGGEPMITIDRHKNSNQIVVSVLRIVDDRNNVIARIDEDGFWVENSTRSKRPDPHTMQVYDHNDMEVLHIVFLNPRAILVTGIFRHRGVAVPVIVTSRNAVISGITFTDAAFGESQIADIVVN